MGLKQLKKSDFLSCITKEPMTRGDLVDALDEYNFIASYFDYLLEHFIHIGKVIRNEDGTIQLKAKKSSTPRDAYRVYEDNTGLFMMEEKKITTLLSEKEKVDGWATTPNAAVKKAKSKIFTEYKRKTSEIQKFKDY